MNITQKLAILSAGADLLTAAGYASTDGSTYTKAAPVTSPAPKSELLQVSINVGSDNSVTVVLSYAKVGSSGDVISVRKSVTNPWDGKEFILTSLSEMETECITLGQSII